jgi:hypothetical protein
MTSHGETQNDNHMRTNQDNLKENKIHASRDWWINVQK